MAKWLIRNEFWNGANVDLIAGATRNQDRRATLSGMETFLCSNHCCSMYFRTTTERYRSDR